MSSDGDDCAALTQQISETLSCNDSREFCQSITDENAETQNKVDDAQEKCLGEENSREVVKETADFSDGVIVELLETDPDQRDIDYSQYISNAQEQADDGCGAARRSLCATVTMAYIPGDSLNDEEDDEA